MAITLEEKRIKLLIKEGVKEAIDAQFMKFSALLLPYVSSKEQKAITRLYGHPSRKIARSYVIKL